MRELPMDERCKRLTAHEREHGLMVCVRIEYRRPGKSKTSVGSGEYSTAWKLLPERGALELLRAALSLAFRRIGARPVYSPSGEADGPWMHSPRYELGLGETGEDHQRQGALFAEERAP